ncbi:MAG: aspartate kinase [Deltaproteobacteria bacterium]|nr:aspartate kinase [Deltaproteobacteria bacterium]
MALIVQKYGGTSVGDIQRIKNVAQRVIDSRKQGHDVIVVVSAMSGETNRLIALAQQVTSDCSGPEVDLLLATGEQVTVSLLGLALQEMGQPSHSYLGSQVKIVTDKAFSKALIQSIDARKIHMALAEGCVGVIAGFQGVTCEGEITTLGRGGSDTSAVAIAAAVKADLCEIYTDVDGVYTADPRICPNARKLDKISHEEMLELASLGSKVLQIRSVELAANHQVNLMVRSSFNNNAGTLLTSEESTMEKIVVSGVALDESEAKLAIRDVPDQPGICMQVFGAIAEANINVDMIIQNTGADGRADLSFTVPALELAKAKKIVMGLKDKLGFTTIDADEDIAKVSIVGVGMRSHAGVAAKAFALLAQNKINIDMISTSEIKISVVVRKGEGKKAVAILHDGFELYAT